MKMEQINAYEQALKDIEFQISKGRDVLDVIAELRESNNEYAKECDDFTDMEEVLVWK